MNLYPAGCGITKTCSMRCLSKVVFIVLTLIPAHRLNSSMKHMVKCSNMKSEVQKMLLYYIYLNFLNNGRILKIQSSTESADLAL